MSIKMNKKGIGDEIDRLLYGTSTMKKMQA